MPDNKVDPHSEPGTSGVILLSTNTRWKQAGWKRGGRKCKSVRWLLIFFFFVLHLGGGGWVSGAWGDSMIHVTLHHRLIAPSTCSKTTNPFCFPWAGPIVPIHEDRDSARHVHHLPQCSRIFVLT